MQRSFRNKIVDLKAVAIDLVASSAYLNFGWNKASLRTKIRRSNSLCYQIAIDSTLDGSKSYNFNEL